MQWNNSTSVLEDKAQISSVIYQWEEQLMTRSKASVPGTESEYWNSIDLGSEDTLKVTFAVQ